MKIFLNISIIKIFFKYNINFFMIDIIILNGVKANSFFIFFYFYLRENLFCIRKKKNIYIRNFIYQNKKISLTFKKLLLSFSH